MSGLLYSFQSASWAEVVAESLELLSISPACDILFGFSLEPHACGMKKRITSNGQRTSSRSHPLLGRVPPAMAPSQDTDADPSTAPDANISSAASMQYWNS